MPARTARCRSRKSVSASDTAARRRSSSAAPVEGSRSWVAAVTAPVLLGLCKTDRGAMGAAVPSVPVNETVRELLAAERPTWSFEFFPPKTPDGAAQLWTALRELERLRPSFVSVTYGAGGAAPAGARSGAQRVAPQAPLTPPGPPPPRPPHRA